VPAGDPCAGVGDGVRAVWDQQAADATDPQVKQAATDMRDKAVARLVRHCRDDGWSAAVATCVQSGQSTCTNKMTPEQKQKLEADRLGP
jgi:hypothetical protein